MRTRGFVHPRRCFAQLDLRSERPRCRSGCPRRSPTVGGILAAERAFASGPPGPGAHVGDSGCHGTTSGRRVRSNSLGELAAALRAATDTGHPGPDGRCRQRFSVASVGHVQPNRGRTDSSGVALQPNHRMLLVYYQQLDLDARTLPVQVLAGIHDTLERQHGGPIRRKPTNYLQRASWLRHPFHAPPASPGEISSLLEGHPHRQSDVALADPRRRRDEPEGAGVGDIVCRVREVGMV